jgi:SAM-dependent methyltransferase
MEQTKVETESFERQYPDDAFSREDENDDRHFYEQDRMVAHLDSEALATIEDIIGQLIVEDHPVVLDLMASWDSHIPRHIRPARLVGLGLNANELAANDELDEVVIHDLNQNPELPFADETFDVVVNTVSVDYLVHPFKVFREVGRILKPGGLHLVFFSNRMFPQKAVKIWRDATEMERVGLVEDFFRAAGCFEPSQLFISSGKVRPADDKYAHTGLPSDPVYVVYADKSGAGESSVRRPAIKLAADQPPLTEEERMARLEAIRTSLECPYCGSRMKKWKVPDSTFSTWDGEFRYICFNDRCPYVTRGWQVMARQGNQGMSYRLMYDPERNNTVPIPIYDHYMLRESIVEE